MSRKSMFAIALAHFLAFLCLCSVPLFSQTETNGHTDPSILSTPGQAFFASNGMFFVPSNVNSAAPGNGALAANAVAVFGFVLPVKITIDHVSLQVSTTEPNSTANAGIYSASGNLLIDSGSFDTSTNSPQYKINKIAVSVTLSPGYYYFAYSLSSTSVHLATLTPQSGTSTAPNAYALTTGTGQPRYGIAANSVTNGGTSTSALPATLGTITSNENPAIPIVIFEP